MRDQWNRVYDLGTLEDYRSGIMDVYHCRLLRHSISGMHWACILHSIVNTILPAMNPKCSRRASESLECSLRQTQAAAGIALNPFMHCIALLRRNVHPPFTPIKHISCPHTCITWIYHLQNNHCDIGLTKHIYSLTVSLIQHPKPLCSVLHAY